MNKEVYFETGKHEFETGSLLELECSWHGQKIMVAVDGEETYFRVIDICSALGVKNKRSRFDIYNTLREYTVKYRFHKQCGSKALIMHKTFVVDLLIPKIMESSKPGYIYGFKLKNVENAYKFGKCEDWTNRKKEYKGYNTVGDLLFLIKVDYMRLAEYKVLQKAVQILGKPYEGHEWFRSGVEDVKAQFRDWASSETFWRNEYFAVFKNKVLDFAPNLTEAGALRPN